MSDSPDSIPTVYIVDDDESVRHSLKTIAERHCLQVRCFSSADEFLGLSDVSFSGCLILDICMPGMGGLELHRKLKAKGVLLPVIMITGHGDQSLAQGATNDGIVAFLEKPFPAKKLIDALDKAMSGPEPPD